MIDLTAIRARLAAITPWPWSACGVRSEPAVTTGVGLDAIEPRKHKNGACSCGYVWSTPMDAPVLEVIGGAWGDTWPAIRKNEDGTLEPFLDRSDYGEVPPDIQAANMKFIAHAPTDLAAACDEIEKLRAALRPFAEHANIPPIMGGRGENTHKRTPKDNEQAEHCYRLTWGMFRRAAEALGDAP